MYDTSSIRLAATVQWQNTPVAQEAIVRFFGDTDRHKGPE